MREHRTETIAALPWHLPVVAEDVPESGARFALLADAQVRAEIARIAGLRDLPRLQADFEVSRHGAGGLHVRGKVVAAVAQTCVVTLEPVANVVEEEIDLVFLPRTEAAPRSGDEAKSASHATPAVDEPERLVGGMIDLGALAAEFLILGIDPYPRKPGAVFEPPPELETEPGPFAALAEWGKDRQGRDDG